MPATRSNTRTLTLIASRPLDDYEEDSVETFVLIDDQDVRVTGGCGRLLSFQELAEDSEDEEEALDSVEESVEDGVPRYGAEAVAILNYYAKDDHAYKHGRYTGAVVSFLLEELIRRDIRELAVYLWFEDSDGSQGRNREFIALAGDPIVCLNDYFSAAGSDIDAIRDSYRSAFAAMLA